jgi:hypothetical protein
MKATNVNLASSARLYEKEKNLAFVSFGDLRRFVRFHPPSRSIDGGRYHSRLLGRSLTGNSPRTTREEQKSPGLEP